MHFVPRLAGLSLPHLPPSRRPVLILSRTGDAELSRHVEASGARPEQEAEFYTGLAAVIDDPSGWSALVICCDDYGGLEAGLRAHRLLGEAAGRLPVYLMSAECGDPTGPDAAGGSPAIRLPDAIEPRRVQGGS